MTKDEALKLALEALEGLIKRTSGQAIYSFMETERRIAMAACVGLREALAQPQQEPVAYRSRLESGSYTYCNTAQFFDNAEPLYTSPPARKPLTDEQVAAAWSVADGEHNASAAVKRRITRAIEAAHGIKGDA